MLKIAHWTILNGSGMHRMAESMAAAETVIGLESVVCDPSNVVTWEAGVDADVHVCHTHVPDQMRAMATKPFKYVYVGHGTPEHVYQTAWDAATSNRYGHADSLMLMLHHLKNADARVTFWPRHQAIYQSLCDKGVTVDCVPMGVETEYWSGGTTRGKYTGEPSVFTAENQHPIKWILDLVIAWPWVTQRISGAMLHATYVPQAHHRVLFPLADRNGAAYKAHISPIAMDKDTLRNAMISTDFFVGLVRYGDFNRLCMEANAAGATTISYAGNEYADYWIPEGDQRVIAETLADILEGKVEKRAKTAVPDISATAQAMRLIYERIS